LRRIGLGYELRLYQKFDQWASIPIAGRAKCDQCLSIASGIMVDKITTIPISQSAAELVGWPPKNRVPLFIHCPANSSRGYLRQPAMSARALGISDPFPLL